MRTIKFRGKANIDGQWKYGDLHQRRGLAWNDYYIIENDVTNIHLVDPKTVGQFTGFYGWAKEEIYEGDIVHFKQKSKVFHGGLDCDDIAAVVFRNGMWQFDEPYHHCLCHMDTMLVKGNIYDNPELLEGCQQ